MSPPSEREGDAVTTGIVRPARRPAGFVPVGPKPAQLGGPKAGEDLCYLTGDWRILQLTGGHRWSLDDLVTAHVATQAIAGTTVEHALDLGCGIGSVLLMTAWWLRSVEQEPEHVGIEAQAQSAALCRRSITYNGVAGDVRVIEGDLREVVAGEALADKRFDLVTGTPPYFHAQEGPLAEHAQKVQCRFEARGTVADYIEAGARVLAEYGVFVLCDVAYKSERVHAAAQEAGLSVHAQLDVVGRAGKAPLISVYTLRRTPRALPQADTLAVRDAQGQWTEAFKRVRRNMGMPAGERTS